MCQTQTFTTFTLSMFDIKVSNGTIYLNFGSKMTQCTMLLSIEIHFKILKSKNLDFPQFWSKSVYSTSGWWKTLKIFRGKYFHQIFVENVAKNLFLVKVNFKFSSQVFYLTMTRKTSKNNCLFSSSQNIWWNILRLMFNSAPHTYVIDPTLGTKLLRKKTKAHVLK